jgi:predicted NBD/HSP70 family sugar kinase
VTEPVAGLDVGGTTTRGVLSDRDGTTRATIRTPTPIGDRTTVVGTIVEAVRRLAQRAAIAPDALGAIGIGVPGIVDPATGEVRHAVNLAVGREPLAVGAAVGRAFGVPVIVDNDANAAALGAAELLGTRDDLAYLSVGTGVAVGLVLDGTLRRGWRGAAGEIGHIAVDPLGPPCPCGQRGCLEAVASGAALARRWPVDDGESPAAAMFTAARGGDERAIRERDRLASHLARAVGIICLTVDPAVVVLGGGIADAGPPLLDAVRRALHAPARRSPLLADLALADRLVLLPAGADPGVVGAVAMARNHEPASLRTA